MSTLEQSRRELATSVGRQFEAARLEHNKGAMCGGGMGGDGMYLGSYPITSPHTGREIATVAGVELIQPAERREKMIEMIVASCYEPHESYEASRALAIREQFGCKVGLHVGQMMLLSLDARTGLLRHVMTLSNGQNVWFGTNTDWDAARYPYRQAEFDPLISDDETLLFVEVKGTKLGPFPGWE